MVTTQKALASTKREDQMNKLGKALTGPWLFSRERAFSKLRDLPSWNLHRLNLRLWHPNGNAGGFLRALLIERTRRHHE